MEPADAPSPPSYAEASEPGQDIIPPSYAESSQPVQDLIPPGALILDGQQIRREAEGSPPLYSLSLGLAGIAAITTELELSRVEPKMDGSGTRSRHIYNLRHMDRTPGGFEPLPSESPSYYIQRARKQVPGPAAVGLKKGTSLIPGRPARSSAVPLDLSGKDSKFGIPTFDKKREAVFACNGRQWSDPQGTAVALMYHSSEDGRYSLVVTATLPRAQFDMLVALWCCHIWDLVVANIPKVHEGIDGVLRKLNQGKEFGAIR